MTDAITYEPVSGAAEDPAAPTGLAARFRPLRTRSGANADRWLLVAGGLAIPLGFLLIVLGWVGSSRTPFVFEQIPYVISGGFLGAALVFGGGFVYFAYWQTRILRDAREHQSQVIAELRALALAMNGQSNGTSNGAGAALPSLDAGAHAPSAAAFVSTEKGSMFHRADCPVAVGRDNLRTVRGDEPGLKPCGICNPLVASR